MSKLTDPKGVSESQELILSQAFAQVEVPTFSQTDRLDRVMENDLQWYTAMLAELRMSWGQVGDVNGVVKLVNATMRVLEGRRKALLLPTEAPLTSSAAKYDYIDYDD